jgi:hypothetical protein
LIGDRAVRAAALGLAAIAAACGQASAQQPNVTLDYDLSAAGLGAASFRISAKFDGSAYTIVATGQTRGAAALLEDLTVSATSIGSVDGPLITPRWFGTDNILDGEARATRVAWSGNEAVAQLVAPSLDAEERKPIPDVARLNALDPIAAMFSFAVGWPAQGKCDGYAKAFDGRRSYNLILDAADGSGVIEQVEVGGALVHALKCRISSQRTGGKSPDGWFSSSREYEHATIWFWRDASGRAIPVRLEADAPIGTGVAQLKALPAQ